MKYKILILALINILFISCVDLSKDKKYKKSIQFFEQQRHESTSHFPLEYTSIANDYSYNVDTTAYFNTLSFNLTITDKLEIEKVKSIYSKEKQYSINDNCLIVLNDFIKADSIPFIPSERALLYDDMDREYMTTFSNNCKGNKYKMIPNFWSNTSGRDKNSKNNLDDNFRYIILDMDMGKGVNSPKLNPNISYMPDFAKHGYSKGIAFNEKENIIIYWLIFW